MNNNNIQFCGWGSTKPIAFLISSLIFSGLITPTEKKNETKHNYYLYIL